MSFKQAVNDTIREGAEGRAGCNPFQTEPATLGLPAVNLDRALQLAAELEDEEAVRKMRARR